MATARGKPQSLMRSGFALSGGPTRSPRQPGLEMRSRHFTRMVRPAAVVRGNPRVRLLRLPQLSFVKTRRNQNSSFWRPEHMKLRALAHSRTGDKGNTSNISVIAFRDEDYSF